ncbi:MAG: dihydrolipoyl dehydrogenase [Gammaproteobacteria bacterium]|nr:dihydrolipoyl dehydrogenase [Gammaproteobacteria bacterium]
MSNLVEVTLPDIGDFTEVDIIEVLVKSGDNIEVEDPILTLESDKATMSIPSPFAGRVDGVMVNVRDKISKGETVLNIELAAGVSPEEKPQFSTAPVGGAVKETADINAEVVVLGAGPGGYTAAFRAADLGKKTVLIERHTSLGGVCLNVGCIPSKTLLHAADVINEAAEMEQMGISFGKPKVDLEKLRAGKDSVVNRLTGGIAALAKQRKVQVINGWGQFESPNRISVDGPDGKISIAFDHAIIACGSRPVEIPGFPNDDPRLINSTGALALESVPNKMLVVGGGIIGLEMGTVYSTLGSAIDVVELQSGLIPGCDPDLVRPLQKRLKEKFSSIMLQTKVTDIKAQKSGLKVSFEGKHAPEKPKIYDKVLVAVGRVPNGNLIGADQAGVDVDERGFIAVNDHMQTNVPNIYAIGDVVGNPMLAHKATHEAKVAAEVIAGKASLFDPMTIPSVAYTDPEVAWMGLTETQAKADGVAYEKASFPWAASGRALSIGRSEGVTKLLFDPETKRILGAGITGVNAGELIGETVLALEMGADAEDIGLTIHPHPTLNESICMAAEMAEGSITDLMPPRKRK